MTRKYELKKEAILDFFIALYDPFVDEDDVPLKKCREVLLILHLLGFEFLRIFHSVIKSSWGETKLIPEQIYKVACNTLELPSSDFFSDKILTEHVYYIIGFLCNAGLKEKDQRSKDNDVGR